MNNAQRKYLKERVAKIRRDAATRVNFARPQKEPAEIIAARKLIRRYELTNRRKWDRERAKLDKAYSIVYRAVLFGTDAAAVMRAVDAYEKKVLK